MKIEDIKKNATNEERKRVTDLTNLKNIPGVSDIVDQAIKNGESVEETTLKIANSDNIKKIKNVKKEVKANELIDNIVGIKNSISVAR